MVQPHRGAACRAIGCRAAVLSSEPFCLKHFAMLNTDTQRVVGKTFRAHVRKQTAAGEAALDFARREILFYQTNGHRLPVDRPFEWDDPIKTT